MPRVAMSRFTKGIPTNGKTAILGRGFLGGAFARLLPDAYVVGREEWRRWRQIHSWEWVINCTGSNRRRDSNETQNVETTKEALRDFPTEHWIQVGSIVAERDEEYGRQKLEAERQVLLSHEDALLVRLGALVGQGQTKGPFYDLKHGRLYVSPDSTLPVIDVDDAVRLIWECRDMEGVLNVAGKGRCRLGDYATFPVEQSLPEDSWDIDITRLESRLTVPDSRETLRRYLTT